MRTSILHILLTLFAAALSAAELPDVSVMSRRTGLMQQEMGVIRLKIHDNGQPLAARVTIRNPDGKCFGSLKGVDWFWAEGTCYVAVPEGVVNVTAEAGPCVVGITHGVKVEAGKTVELVLSLSQHRQVREAGWLLFDPFVRASNPDASEDMYQYREMNDLCAAGQSEGVEVMGIAGALSLEAAGGKRYSNMSGGIEQLRQDMRNVRCPGIYTWFSEAVLGGQFYALESRPPTKITSSTSLLFPLMNDIRDRGGVSVMNLPAGRLLDTEKGLSGDVAGELVFDVLAGPVFDAIDIGVNDTGLWEFLLSRGHRITALAGGPQLGITPGLDVPSARCYVRAENTEPATVIDAIRSGKVVISNGPFLNLQVAGAGMGEVVSPRSGKRFIQIEAVSSSHIGDEIKLVELVYNGQVIGSWKGARCQRAMQVKVGRILNEIGWVIARYRSKKKGLWAMTNPVYIRSAQIPRPAPVTAKATVRLFNTKIGAHVDGVVDILNRGKQIESVRIDRKGSVIEVPATASLRFTAPGGKVSVFGIYRDGGAQKMIEKHAAEGRLREALLQETTYAEMKKLLQNMAIEIRF